MKYEVKQLLGRGYDSNAWFVMNNGQEGLLVDTGIGSSSESKEILTETRKQVSLLHVVLTHGHIDHSGGLFWMDWDKDPDVRVYVHKSEEQYLKKGIERFIDPVFGSKIEPFRYDFITVEEGSEIQVGNLLLKVLHTPGHTIGSICLYDEQEKILFSGDTVFSRGSFGRYDFITGNHEQLIVSLERLSKLDVKKVYPGHMEPILTEVKKSLQKTYKNASLY